MIGSRSIVINHRMMYSKLVTVTKWTLAGQNLVLLSYYPPRNKITKRLNQDIPFKWLYYKPKQRKSIHQNKTDILDGRVEKQPLLTLYSSIYHCKKLNHDGSVLFMCEQTCTIPDIWNRQLDKVIIHVIYYTSFWWVRLSALRLWF